MRKKENGGEPMKWEVRRWKSEERSEVGSKKLKVRNKESDVESMSQILKLENKSWKREVESCKVKSIAI